MSSAIVKAHGGSKDLIGQKGEISHLGMFVTDTMVGKHRDVAEKHLDSLIARTTGIPREKPIMEGVLSDTKRGVKDTDVPELHKVHKVSKTQPKRYGQVAFNGPKY
jgi:hypothetical protein